MTQGGRANMAEDTSVAVEETAEVDDLGDFDADRALSTIRKQREAEKALKAELAEAKKASEELAELRQAQEDAEKTAQEKLADREATISGLKKQIAESAIRADFIAKATTAERAYLDPELAYLAAEAQGLLGKYDPKSGTVGEHNFDLLEEKYPALAGEGSGASLTGDAGVRRTGEVRTPNSQFNQAVRGSMRR